MQRGLRQGTCGRDLGGVIFYVSVPVQLYHLSRLIPYRVGGVTVCSEGYVVYINFDVFVVRDGVVAHYQDSCVPLVDLVCLEEQREAWTAERSRRVRWTRLPSPGG